MAEITTKLMRLWNESFETDNAIKTFLIVGSGNVHYCVRQDLRTTIAHVYHPFRHSGASAVPEETQEIDLFVSLADALQ
jgi:hypothetical protein